MPSTSTSTTTGVKRTLPRREALPLARFQLAGRDARRLAGWPILPCVCRSKTQPVSWSSAPGVQRALAAVHARPDRDLADLHRCIGLETWRLVKGGPASNASLTLPRRRRSSRLACSSWPTAPVTSI